MTREQLIEKANDRAVEAIRSLRYIKDKEHDRLTELPEKQAVNDLTLLFLIAATYDVARAAC